MLKSYSVFDDKVSCFNTPFFSPSEGAAVRSFGDLTNDSRSTVRQHPADYHLYFVGTFDEDTGFFTPVDKPTFVAHALSLVQPVGVQSDCISGAVTDDDNT